MDLVLGILQKLDNEYQLNIKYPAPYSFWELWTTAKLTCEDSLSKTQENYHVIKQLQLYYTHKT